MGNINTRLVVDGNSAGATQAINNTEQGIDAVQRKTAAAGAQTTKDVGAMRQAWGGLRKQVTLTDEAFLRGNFSGEMIGGALRSVTTDAGKLAAALGSLNKEAEFTAASLTNVTISVISGNPFMALAAATMVLVRNLTEVVKALKDVEQHQKNIRGMRQQSKVTTAQESIREAYPSLTKIANDWKNGVRIIMGMKVRNNDPTFYKDQFVKAPGKTFELLEQREAYQKRMAKIRAEQAAKEAAVTTELTMKLNQLRMSATDFAVGTTQRELDAFKGTEAQRAIAVQIAEEKVKKIRAAAMAAAELRDQQRLAQDAKLQQTLEKLTLSSAEFAVKQAQRELDAYVGTADQRAIMAKITAAKIYKINEDLRKKNLARAKAQAEAELQIKQDALNKEAEARRRVIEQAAQRSEHAAKREADARQKVLMHPAALAARERQERRQFRRDDRANRRLNRIVRTAEAAKAGGRQLSRRQRAALEFVQARNEKKQADKLKDDEAKNIAKMQQSLEQLVKTTAALYGTAAAENKQ